MLPSGFGPESSARKAEMIGRTTPREQYNILMFVIVAPSGFGPLSLAPKANMIDHYTTGLYNFILIYIMVCERLDVMEGITLYLYNI